MIRFLIMLGFFGRISDAALENLIESSKMTHLHAITRRAKLYLKGGTYG